MPTYTAVYRGWYAADTGATFTAAAAPTFVETVESPAPTITQGQAACWVNGAWLIVTDQGQPALAKARQTAEIGLRDLWVRMTPAERNVYVNADDDVMAVALGRTAMAPSTKASLRTMRRTIEMTAEVDLLDVNVVAAVQGLVTIGLLSQARADALLKPS